MNPIKNIIKRARKIPSEENLRKEIRKRFPELDWRDEDEMIRIARETGIRDLGALREELIKRKLERERKVKGSEENVRNSWSIFQKELQAIKDMKISEEKKRELRSEAYKKHLTRIGVIPEEKKEITTKEIEIAKRIYSEEISRILQMNIPEEEKKELARKAYENYLRMIGSEKSLEELEKIFSVGRPRTYTIKESEKIKKEDLEIINELKNIPEEEKTKLTIAAIREHEARARGETYGLPTGYPESVKPFSKIIWRAKVMWPLHKLESEETRMIRAIAWAKRRLDFIARTKNKDVVLKHKIEKMKEYAKRLELKEYADNVKKLRKELDKIEKEINREKNRLSSLGQQSSTPLEAFYKDREETRIRLDNVRKEYEKRREELERFIQTNATDLAVLKEILRGEVPTVLEETKKIFHISSPHLVERLRNSLMEFADAEAAKMIETNYKTIYQAARYKLGFFVKEIYRPVGGPFASLYDLIGIIFRFIFDFIFSPIVIGTILLWLLFSIFIRYMITGPTLAVLIITTIITVLMILGQYWANIFKMFE
ncbi:MAG: hypothetical protein QXJ96_00165 [Candidatus Aenigmatarchaeota archaeon]|nr:hypothetical protein [Candidatus Aenigmarchaeota archaeon]